MIPKVVNGIQPTFILKKGTYESRSKQAQRNNIMAAKLVKELVKSSLGPRGMDKMLITSFGDILITNDGATILKEINVKHPVAKILVEIARTTDSEVGDGTTSAVILAGALLDKAEKLIDKDIHPTIIADGYKIAADKALEILNEIAERINVNDRTRLNKIAATVMLTKLVGRDAYELAELVVNALLRVSEKINADYKVEIDNVKIEKKVGDSLKDTKLINGIILSKEVAHPNMPKCIKNAKIALINSALEIERTAISTEIRINDPNQMKRFLNEKVEILKRMFDKILSTGANVVICQKDIDNLIQHFMVKSGILAVKSVKDSDMVKLAKATGGRVVTDLDELKNEDLGFAELIEERKVGNDKLIFVEGCKNPKAVSILIRGGSDRVIDEVERAIHDALIAVKNVIEKPFIVAGGGASEAHIAQRIRKWSNTLSGKEQLVVQKFAEALETIPLTLAENSGLNPIDIQVELNLQHAKGNKWYGIDVFEGKVCDMYVKDVFEPVKVKEQIIKSAIEAATLILKIDDIIFATREEESSKTKAQS
ncbi:MAG: thermosome subunit beta [Nitrososphaerales archaeon]